MDGHKCGAAAAGNEDEDEDCGGDASNPHYYHEYPIYTKPTPVFYPHQFSVSILPSPSQHQYRNVPSPNQDPNHTPTKPASVFYCHQTRIATIVPPNQHQYSAITKPASVFYHHQTRIRTIHPPNQHQYSTITKSVPSS